MAIATEPPLVPPLRLGRLLRARREAAGRTIDQVARLAPGVSPLLLEDVEAGRVDLTDAELARIAPLYGVDLERVLPQRMRLVIDLDAGRIAVEGEDGAEVTLSGEEADDVLVRYLALLYAIRGMPVGTPLPLRRVDLDVLAEALGVVPDTIQHRLRALMLRPGEQLERSARGIRRRLVVPMVGILVGATTGGTLLLVGDDSPPSVGGTVDPTAVVSEEPTASSVPTSIPRSAPTSAPAALGPAVGLGAATVAEADPVTGTVVEGPRGG